MRRILAGESLSFPAIFWNGAMTRIKRFADEHLDLTAFLGLVALALLMPVALESTKNLTMVLLAGAGLVAVSFLARRKAHA